MSIVHLSLEMMYSSTSMRQTNDIDALQLQSSDDEIAAEIGDVPMHNPPIVRQL